MQPFTPYPGFCGPAYQQTDPRRVLSVDQSINVYPHRNEVGTGKNAMGLVQRPGYTLWGTPGTAGAGRALWAGENRLFSVVGTKFIEWSSGGSPTVRGDIGSGTGVCTVVSNGNQLMIINPNTDILKVDDGASIVTPTTPAGARMGFQLRGYGYIVEPDTNTLFQSDPDDFTTWDPLNQATATISQDRLLQVWEDNGYVWLIGSATSQMWAFVGTAGFALEPVQSAFVTEGTCAPYSVATANSMVCMVSGSRRGFGRVVALTPGRVNRISTYAVEQSIRATSDWGEVTGSGYTANGHNFYELNIPSLDLTWVYDFTENAWHQRRGWTGSAYTSMLGRMVQCTFDNQYFVISPTDGKIYKQREDGVSSDDSTPFRRQRTAPILYGNGRININRFRLDQQIENGGGTTGAAARFSYDGGLTFGSYSTETAGRNGEDGVVEWPQLGQADIRGFVADVVWDSAFEVAVAGASVDVSPGLA